MTPEMEKGIRQVAELEPEWDYRITNGSVRLLLSEIDRLRGKLTDIGKIAGLAPEYVHPMDLKHECKQALQFMERK